MAETNPVSFIPRDAAVQTAQVTRQRGGGLNDLILLSAIVLFVTSAALAIAVFLYQEFLTTESASKLQQLQRAKAAFEPSLIADLTRLDDRMHSADRLLAAHLAPTALFDALEQTTLQSVSFQTLDLQSPDSQHITLKMQGIAESVNAIALQADLFSKNGVITSPIFSNISRQIDGVHFNFSAVVNPNAITFTNILSTLQPTQPTQPTTTAPVAPAAPSADAPFGGAAPQATPGGTQ